MFCATFSALNSIVLLYHAKRKKDISINIGMRVELWMILAVNILGFLFVLIPDYIIDVTNTDALCDYHQQLGDFYCKYGIIYVILMLLSTLLGVIAKHCFARGDGQPSNMG